MRRDQFSVDIETADAAGDDREPGLPTLVVAFEGEDGLDVSLDGDGIDERETDITFRLQDDPDDPDASGVLAITDRVTGDYLLEVNVDAADLLSFVSEARHCGERDAAGEARYRVRVVDDGDVAVYEKRTLLVYSEGGELLRGHSLIPSGVEI